MKRSPIVLKIVGGGAEIRTDEIKQLRDHKIGL
jgi:hypothetical protein